MSNVERAVKDYKIGFLARKDFFSVILVICAIIKLDLRKKLFHRVQTQ